MRGFGASALIHKNTVNLPRFGLKVRYQGNIYDTVPCEIAKKAKRRIKEKKVWVPDDAHYYKYGKRLMGKVGFEEGEQEILEMLENLFFGSMVQ